MNKQTRVKTLKELKECGWQEYMDDDYLTDSNILVLMVYLQPFLGVDVGRVEQLMYDLEHVHGRSAALSIKVFLAMDDVTTEYYADYPDDGFARKKPAETSKDDEKQRMARFFSTSAHDRK